MVLNAVVATSTAQDKNPSNNNPNLEITVNKTFLSAKKPWVTTYGYTGETRQATEPQTKEQAEDHRRKLSQADRDLRPRVERVNASGIY